MKPSEIVSVRDVMSSPVFSLKSTQTVSEAAQSMLHHGLGALPVTDDAGGLVGIVSDGDLLGRRPEDSRRDWWLSLLSRGAGPHDLPAQQLSRPVNEVMSSPPLVVSPATTLDVAAEMMRMHRVKRLPVIDHGQLVGIVSRADLIASAAQALAPTKPAGAPLLDFLESLIGGASLRGAVAHKASPAATGAAPSRLEFTAAALRSTADRFAADKRDLRKAEDAAKRRDRQRRTKALLDAHISDEIWRGMIEHAEIAAEHGESEVLMLRFPSELCSDGGRKIDVAEDGWETTLRGEAAEFYSRWRQELRPSGFHLSARVVSYEAGGVIGDIGLYLTWG